MTVIIMTIISIRIVVNVYNLLHIIIFFFLFTFFVNFFLYNFFVLVGGDVAQDFIRGTVGSHVR